MTAEPGPLVQRRRLGAALRRYREAAGMSAKDAAGRLLVSPTQISRIESAQRNATLRDVRDLCEIYGISDEGLRRELMDLARGGRERGWWQGAGLEPALGRLIGSEAAASRISEFEILALPGLIQTSGYARAMFELYGPADPERREKALEIRLRRSEILRADPRPEFRVVLDEGAVRRVVGGPVVLREQIDHILDLMNSSMISLRIVPFSAGAHLGMVNGFTVLEFTELMLSSSVYSETLIGGEFVDQADTVQHHLEAFDQISSIALTSGESSALLREMRADLVS